MPPTTTGLTNGGKTSFYNVSYIDSLSAASGVNFANSLIAVMDTDFTQMSTWFNIQGKNLANSTPLNVLITPLPYTDNTTSNGPTTFTSAQARWAGNNVFLYGPGTNVAFARYLLASEVTEEFMYTIGSGWGYSFGDKQEGNNGEALSRFLGYQLMVINSLDTSELGGFFVSNQWLNSVRADSVNNPVDDNAPDASVGCCTLFLYYLFHQLSFSNIPQLISNHAQTLHGVYSNLSGDLGDPFPFFSRLVGNAFPGTSQITTGPNFDDPFPLGILSFLTDKSTFGHDEVQDIITTQGGVVSNAFWLVLEGFSIQSFGNFNISIPIPTGNFLSIPGISIRPSPAAVGGTVPPSPIPVWENSAIIKSPQRVRFAFDIVFTNAVLAQFPTKTNPTPVFGELDAVANNGSKTLNGATATTFFELLVGQDPYFTNMDPNNPQQRAYLSQDLRVFPVTVGTSVLGSTPFTTNPYGSIQSLIQHLNSTSTYATPVPSTSPDPIDQLPGQTGFETGDSSVYALGTNGLQNYNFAIARVRLRGLSQDVATNVRVFFRLFVAQSTDTDFQQSTYPSNKGAAGGPDSGLPISPLPSGTGLTDPSGQAVQTIPFFATDASGTHDYDGSNANANIHTITIPKGADSIWVYYGCYLDVFNAAHQSKFPGTHHCVVAEIAYDDAPIPAKTPKGSLVSPLNWDQLAQRNLQITTSENPQSPATHIVPQAFDLRPSNITGSPTSVIQGLPDELMIDWGNTPVGSTATIYWPQLQSADVVALADQFYGSHFLYPADANTLQCTTTSGVTYIPIPSIARGLVNFAGLFTITLPTTIRNGQSFQIFVRRISSVALTLPPPPPEIPVVPPPPQIQIKSRSRGRFLVGNPGSGAPNGPDPDAPPADTSSEREPAINYTRQTVSAFAVNIPVTTAPVMLPPEEAILSVLKWRTLNMDPVNRWFPVLTKLLGLVVGRVDGLGGNSGAVPPTLSGVPPSAGCGKGEKKHHCCCEDGHGSHSHDRHCGKHHGKKHNEPKHPKSGCVGRVSCILYDCHGKVQEFCIWDEEKRVEERFYTSHEELIVLVKKAWDERWVVEIVAMEDRRSDGVFLVEAIVLRRD